MNIVNNWSSTIVTIYQDTVKVYENNQRIIKQCEEELTDLEHEIELANPKDMYKGYLCYRQIRDLRQKRRVAKDENQLLQEMYDFVKSQQGQQFKTKIQGIQSNSAKVFDAQQKRVYVPRQRNDLTIENKTCATASKPFEQLLADFKKEKVTMQNGKLRK